MPTPDGYSFRLTLADGRYAYVRPVIPADVPAIIAVARTADPVDLRGRFGLAADQLDDDRLAALAVVDYRTRFRLLAFNESGDVIGEGSYRLVPADGQPPTADLSVAVESGYRRQGLATELAVLVAIRAQECGIQRVTAMADVEDPAASQIARRAGAVTARAGRVVMATVAISDALRRLEDSDERPAAQITAWDGSQLP